jgi:hypothetical protein
MQRLGCSLSSTSVTYGTVLSLQGQLFKNGFRKFPRFIV